MGQDADNDLMYLLLRAAKAGPYEWEIRDRESRAIPMGVSSRYSSHVEQERFGSSTGRHND
jgi:hypothetical protein